MLEEILEVLKEHGLNLLATGVTGVVSSYFAYRLGQADRVIEGQRTTIEGLQREREEQKEAIKKLLAIGADATVQLQESIAALKESGDVLEKSVAEIEKARAGEYEAKECEQQAYTYIEQLLQENDVLIGQRTFLVTGLIADPRSQDVSANQGTGNRRRKTF